VKRDNSCVVGGCIKFPTKRVWGNSWKSWGMPMYRMKFWRNSSLIWKKLYLKPQEDNYNNHKQHRTTSSEEDNKENYYEEDDGNEYYQPPSINIHSSQKPKKSDERFNHNVQNASLPKHKQTLDTERSLDEDFTEFRKDWQKRSTVHRQMKEPTYEEEDYREERGTDYFRRPHTAAPNKLGPPERIRPRSLLAPSRHSIASSEYSDQEVNNDTSSVRSSSSYGSTRPHTSGVIWARPPPQPMYQKSDPVAKYHELQAARSRDPFLQSQSRNRNPKVFIPYDPPYQPQQKDLNSMRPTFIVPTAKRRDNLRFQVRNKLISWYVNV